MPTHLTPIEPYQQVEPFAEPTFDIDENDQGSATSALDIYALNATRSANSATYRHFVLGDQAHDVAPAGFQDFDWAPPTISHVMDLQEVQPLPDIYDPELLDAQPMPYLSPHVDANSSYGNTPQIDWSALVPVMPLGEGELADQGSNPMSAPLVSRRRSRSPIDERYPHISSSPKRQRRTNSLSRKNRALKRKRSESRILKREKSNSFHEQYIESVRKSGKTPTDIDCFAYNDSDTDEDSKWSTLNLSKKRKDSDPVDAGPEVAAEDLPAAYTRFQPLYKPKVDNNARFVVNTSKFTLPVPALEKRRKDLAERARVSIIQSNSSVRTRKVPLFKPPPPTQRSASAHQGNKVIEIFDDEERKKQKAQVLRGLSSSALGLVQRPKSKSRDGDSPVEESGVSPSDFTRAVSHTDVRVVTGVQEFTLQDYQTGQRHGSN